MVVVLHALVTVVVIIHQDVRALQIVQAKVAGMMMVVKENAKQERAKRDILVKVANAYLYAKEQIMTMTHIQQVLQTKYNNAV